jgi:hypothetical protein
LEKAVEEKGGASETSMIFRRLKLCPSRSLGLEGEGEIKNDYRL